MNYQSFLSKIPSINEIDQFLSKKGLRHGLEIRKDLLGYIEKIRKMTDWLAKKETTRESILEDIHQNFAKRLEEPTVLINATGTIIHTNLGRSVLSAEIFDEIKELCLNYTNLEFSLATGKRGQRLAQAINLLLSLTGAEDAMVVNNNAAGVLLALSGLSKGQEVVISRGELVEIGGSFRIPEIISESGAILREVGTTNKTNPQDYENAISEQTALLLKVHCSNYRIQGFTQEVTVQELAEIGRKYGKPVVFDVGSGSLGGFHHPQLNRDPIISQLVKQGADLVTFSGDKLIGGPQAGILVGKSNLIERLKNHPLYRALRCDKITMLLLEKTLAAYANQSQLVKVPTQRMLNENLKQVKQRAEYVLEELDPKSFTLVPCTSTPGGGALPGETIDSWGIAIIKSGSSANQTLDRLRYSKTPVIARIETDRVICDMRTVLPHQTEILLRILKEL